MRLMTESKLKRLKIRDVVSLKSYIWLVKWKDDHSRMPYKIAPEQSFYKNRSHRNYLSKWLEEVIIQIITKDGWFVKKIETVGKQIRGKNGRPVWIKQRSSSTPGEPDIESIIDGRVVYWEVKVKKDRMSAKQKEFKARMEEIGGKVHTVKTLDDFLEQYEPYANNVTWTKFDHEPWVE